MMLHHVLLAVCIALVIVSYSILSYSLTYMVVRNIRTRRRYHHLKRAYLSKKGPQS